jgi:hypothetical protein
MENEEPISPSTDRPLAAEMPDPAGSPQAVEANDPVVRAIASLGIGAVVLGGLTLFGLSGTTATAGATRSAKLQWECRQRPGQESQQTDQGQRPDGPRGDESRSHD